jgi:ethanolamine transporter EutH
LHYFKLLGSLVKKRAKATPKNAPASVSVAFPQNTKAKLAHISTAPSTLVFQLSKILLNIIVILAAAGFAVLGVFYVTNWLLSLFHFLNKIVKAVLYFIAHLFTF